MNKYLKIGLCLLLTIFVFTGCENKANETKKEDDNSLSVYEYHYYDNDFNHTEDFIVKYDKSGNFKELQMIYNYDKRPNSDACSQIKYTKENYIDLTYPGVSASCIVDEKGQTLIWSMTDESVSAGYLKDENKDYSFALKYVYDSLETEEKANEYMKKAVEEFKKQNVVEDDRNYLVIKNEKVKWN